MPTTPTVFYRGDVPASGAGLQTVYTLPTSNTTILTEIVLTNNTSSPITASIVHNYLTNMYYLKDVSILANGTMYFSIKMVLPILGAIQAVQSSSTASNLTLHLTGVRIT